MTGDRHDHWVERLLSSGPGNLHRQLQRLADDLAGVEVGHPRINLVPDGWVVEITGPGGTVRGRGTHVVDAAADALQAMDESTMAPRPRWSRASGASSSKSVT